MNEPTINAERLRASLAAMAKVGPPPLDARARERLARCCREAGCTVEIDPLGNVVARRAGRNAALAPVVVAGRADSEPSVCGVLAALEVIRTLNDSGIETERPIELWAGIRVESARAVHAFFETTPDALIAVESIEAGANALLGAILVRANELPDVFTSNATQALA